MSDLIHDAATAYKIKLFAKYLLEGWSIEYSRSKSGMSVHRWNYLRQVDPEFRDLVLSYRKQGGTTSVIPAPGFKVGAL